VAVRVIAEERSIERKNERRMGGILGWSGDVVKRIFSEQLGYSKRLAKSIRWWRGSSGPFVPSVGKAVDGDQ
jgi:hypothetical protein